MADNPPYMGSAKQLEKVLSKVRAAKTPPRFTNDFLYTKLSVKTKSARPFIGVAKRLGLLKADGTPTERYKAFRSTNKATSGAAMAAAIRTGYSELYARNEYAHSLSSNDLKGLVIEVTGLEADNQIVRAIVATFETLKKHADFEITPDSEEVAEPEEEAEEEAGAFDARRLRMGLSYTINLVLPKTDDISVFNAIFKSLRENLLRE